MIDAYTIGITLALDDGVSAGVAAIAKDLEVLDRAIDSSALRLAQLRRMADGVLSAGYLPPRGRAEKMHVRPVAADRDSAASPVLHVASQDRSMPPALQAVPAAVPAAPAAAAPLRQAAVSQSATLLPKPVAIVAPPPAAVTASVAPPAPAAPAVRQLEQMPVEPAPPVVSVVHAIQPAASAAPAPAAPIIAAPPAPGPALPMVAAPRPARTPPPAAPAAPHPAFGTGAPTIDLTGFAHRMALPKAEATPAVLLSSPPASPSRPMPAVPQAPVLSQHLPGTLPAPAAPPPRHVDTARSRHAVAPRLVEQHILHVPAAAPPMPRPAAPPPASSPASPAPGGDVFLDGVRVGHWLSRHLDRAATRPPAGTTGFDPRLSPSWAGATVSN